MRNSFLLFVALLFACGGKHTTQEPPAIDDRSSDDRDAGLGGPDAGFDGGLDGGTDGGVDGGLGGYAVSFSLSPNPYTHGSGTAGEAPGEALICCTTSTIINCQTERSGGVFSPARRLAVLGAGMGPVRAEIYSDANCHTLDRTLSSSLNFPEIDLWAVNVDFTPPLPIGMRLSIKWTAGTCDPVCANYVIGTSPAGCWQD